jgi:hypothetical protein
VAYLLKARVVELQQLDITRQWCINSGGIKFSAQSITIAVDATLEYFAVTKQQLHHNRETVFYVQSMLGLHKRVDLSNISWHQSRTHVQSYSILYDSI